MVRVDELEELLERRNNLLNKDNNNDALKEIDKLINQIIILSPNIIRVITAEDMYLEPGEKKEIKTSITNLKITKGISVLLKGYISEDSYLKFTVEYEDGYKIYAENISPLEKEGEVSKKYFEPGTYYIEKNQVIGIVSQDKTKILSYH